MLPFLIQLCSVCLLSPVLQYVWISSILSFPNILFSVSQQCIEYVSNLHFFLLSIFVLLYFSSFNFIIIILLPYIFLSHFTLNSIFNSYLYYHVYKSFFVIFYFFLLLCLVEFSCHLEILF